MTVYRLLTELGYSMQGNQKAIEGNSGQAEHNLKGLIVPVKSKKVRG